MSSRPESISEDPKILQIHPVPGEPGGGTEPLLVGETKYLSTEQIQQMYEGGLRQLETQIVETQMNFAIAPGEREALVKRLQMLKAQLQRLEKDYARWQFSSESADSKS